MDTYRAILNPNTAWNNAHNQWFSKLEKLEYKNTLGSCETSTDELGCMIDIHAINRAAKNKHIFIKILVNDEGHLCVVPTISIEKNDF